MMTITTTPSGTGRAPVGPGRAAGPVTGAVAPEAVAAPDDAPGAGQIELSGPPVVRRAPVGRAALVAALVFELQGAGVTWAFQGPADAVARWCAADDLHDLDLWVAAADAPRAEAVVRELGGVLVASADDPRRLVHRSFYVDVDGRPAIVDLTVGDLRVGPVRLCPGPLVTVAPAPVLEATAGADDPVVALRAPRLLGAAAVVDLAVRPLLRGRVPAADRLDEARRAWRRLGPDGRAGLEERLQAELGTKAGADVVAVLDGAPCGPSVVRRARRSLTLRSVHPRSFAATWSQRAAVAPAGRSAGPLGLRTAGVLVVLVGTDGSGKSTVSSDVVADLEQLGLPVRTAYFGMARGNLPGVALARRVLGIGGTPDLDGSPAEGAGPAPAASDVAAPAAEVVRPGLDPAPADPAAADGVAVDRSELDHPRLRQVAAWYYAAEYGWRYATTVAPALARHEVVVCDRWITDLRLNPWPGSAASRVVERLVPRPDVLALPDAPAAMIHARKPERTVTEIIEHQHTFRGLLADAPDGCTPIVVDTSGAEARPHRPLVRAIVAAAHRRTGGRPA